MNNKLNTNEKLKSKPLLCNVFFTRFFVSGAKYHIEKANEIIKHQTDCMAIFGKEYKETVQYAGLNFKEKWHLLMFNVYRSFLGL